MIKDPETEARELQSVLNSVGETLRANIFKPGRMGITYAEFKARKALDDFSKYGEVGEVVEVICSANGKIIKVSTGEKPKKRRSDRLIDKIRARRLKGKKSLKALPANERA